MVQKLTATSFDRFRVSKSNNQFEQNHYYGVLCLLFYVPGIAIFVLVYVILCISTYGSIFVNKLTYLLNQCCNCLEGAGFTNHAAN